MSQIGPFLAAEGWLRAGAGPLYLQLRARIEAALAARLLGPQMPLPPEREISALTGLSRVTVRKAMAELAEQGLIVQRQGSGSFVAPVQQRMQQSLARLTSFSEDMARRGLTTTATWLERGLFRASPREAEVLGLPPGADVARLGRVRSADGRPLAIERASLPVTVLPNPLAVGASLYDTLRANGHAPATARQKITAVNLEPDDAALLELPAGRAGLTIERVTRSQAGEVLEFTRSVYRGDAYDFVTDLTLGEMP